MNDFANNRSFGVNVYQTANLLQLLPHATSESHFFKSQSAPTDNALVRLPGHKAISCLLPTMLIAL